MKKKKVLVRTKIPKTIYLSKEGYAAIEKARKKTGKKISAYFEYLHGIEAK